MSLREISFFVFIFVGISSSLWGGTSEKPPLLSPKEAAVSPSPGPRVLPWPQEGVTFPKEGLLTVTLGNPLAPITLHEISSVTCHHCAQFHRTVFPELKKKYIETGRLKVVIIHCPTDGVSTRAAIVLSQLPETKRYELMQDMWGHQPSWFPEDFSPKNLKKMAQELGKWCVLPENEILRIMSDHKLAEEIIKSRSELDRCIQLDGTPTFIINGEVLLKAPTLENLEEMIEKRLKMVNNGPVTGGYPSP